MAKKPEVKVWTGCVERDEPPVRHEGTERFAATAMFPELECNFPELTRAKQRDAELRRGRTKRPPGFRTTPWRKPKLVLARGVDGVRVLGKKRRDTFAGTYLPDQGLPPLPEPASAKTP